VNIGVIVRRAQKAAADKAPTILTALGVTGLVTTAVLTGKASFKAADVVAKQHHRLVDNEFEPLPPLEKFKILLPDVWKLYVPAIGTGAVTIACILCANHVSTRRTAALASAYSIAQEGFREYRAKVIDTIGDKKEQVVQNKIAEDRVTASPPSKIYVLDEDENIFLDMYSGRYFKSTMTAVKKAENDTNYEILSNDYASLSDLWDRLGLPKTSESDDIGWNTDMKLDLIIGTAITPDEKKPCFTISFLLTPVRGFWSVHG
jgi:hypothetical protein